MSLELEEVPGTTTPAGLDFRSLLWSPLFYLETTLLELGGEHAVAIGSWMLILLVITVVLLGGCKCLRCLVFRPLFYKLAYGKKKKR